MSDKQPDSRSTIDRFVINLADRRDRRVAMEAQLWRVGWQALFLPACRPDSVGEFPSIGARGCFLSHVNTLRQGARTNKHIIIMEDDLNFVADFPILWERAYYELSHTDWSIFYAGHTLEQPVEGLFKVDPLQSIRCGHFVMFNRNVIEEILGDLDAILGRPAGHRLGGPMHVDGAYSTIRAQKPHLHTYAYGPSLGYQRSSRSDIAELKFYDKNNVFRFFVDALRRIKGSVA